MNFIVLLILVCQVKTISASIIPCSNDSSCEKNQYCGASRCMGCISCSYINRENLFDCPKSLYDCGRCLTGYSEIPRNDVTTDHIKICEIQVENYENTCSNDMHCPGGQLCIKQKCKVCLNCRSYHMDSSTVCAKTTNDCGSCLPGYLELVPKEESHPRSCTGPTASLLSQNTEVQVNVNAMSTIGVMLIVGLSGLVAIFIYRARKHRSDRVNISDAPPPYTTSIVNNAASDEVVERSVMCTSYKESSEVDNTARVFRLPSYADSPSENRTSIMVNQTRDEVDDVSIMCATYKESGEADNTARVFRLPNYLHPPANNNVDSIQTHDEETMPCSWRPDNEENIVHSMPPTFAGRLTAETATNGTPAFSEQPAAKRQKTSD